MISVSNGFRISEGKYTNPIHTPLKTEIKVCIFDIDKIYRFYRSEIKSSNS